MFFPESPSASLSNMFDFADSDIKWKKKFKKLKEEYDELAKGRDYWKE